MIQRFFATFAVFLVLLISGGFALAQGGGDLGGGGGGDLKVNTGKLENPIKADTFGDFIADVIDAAIAVLWPFIVLAFIYSGFIFVKAQGKPEEIQKAKTAMIYSIIGAFILLGAKGFAEIIGTTVKNVTQ